MVDRANVNMDCLSTDELQGRLLELCDFSATKEGLQLEEVNAANYRKQHEPLKISKVQHLSELEQSKLADQNELNSLENQILELESNTLNSITEQNHEIQLSAHLEELKLQYKTHEVDLKNLQQAELKQQQAVDKNIILFQTFTDYKEKHYNLNEKLTKLKDKLNNNTKQKKSIIMQKNDKSKMLQDLKFALLGTMEEETAFNANLEADLTLTRMKHQTLCGVKETEEKTNSIFNEVDVNRASVKYDYLGVKGDYLKATSESNLLNKILKDLKTPNLMCQRQDAKFLEKCITKFELQNVHIDVPKKMKFILTSLEEVVDARNMLIQKAIDCADFDLFLSSHESKKVDDLNTANAEDKSINYDYNHRIKHCEQEISTMEKQINELHKTDERLIKMLDAVQEPNGNLQEICFCKLQK